MTGQELYERWIKAMIESNGECEPWSRLTSTEQKAWNNLAHQIRLHVQDSIGKVFE